MKYVFAALSIFFLSVQEKATLTVPLTLGSITEYEVGDVSLSRPRTLVPGGTWSVNIIYYDNTGKVYTDNHSGVFNAITNPNGASVIVKKLNKADLSIKSLNCRAIEHLQAEGKIPAGTNSCTPE